jgi:hypothetical protein
MSHEMKLNLLPPTDVANFAALDRAAKWKAVVHFHTPRFQSVSYASFRGRLPDCLGLDAGRFPLGRVDQATMERVVIGDCKIKSSRNYTANLQVARGALAWAEAQKIGGNTAPELSPHRMGGHIVEPWNRLALNISDQLVIPFFDPRRTSSRLGSLGMQVAFSIMHENIRVIHPDYADARLAIVQFADVKGEVRPATIYYDDGVDLIPYKDLIAMIDELYEMYDAVCAGREEDVRRYADDVPEEDWSPMERMWRKG